MYIHKVHSKCLSHFSSLECRFKLWIVMLIAHRKVATVTVRLHLLVTELYKFFQLFSAQDEANGIVRVGH